MYFWASLERGKESTCQCRRCNFSPWVGKIPCRRKRQPTPVFLPGEFYGQRNLVGYSPQGFAKIQTQLSDYHSAYRLETLSVWNLRVTHLLQTKSVDLEGNLVFGDIICGTVSSFFWNQSSSDSQWYIPMNSLYCWSDCHCQFLKNFLCKYPQKLTLSSEIWIAF